MQREELSVGQERAILIGCLLPSFDGDPNDPLGELRSLVDTAGAICVDELIQKRRKPDPATYIGKGKVHQLAEMVQALDAQVVIFENDLSPSQIGKIEEAIECKVLDRSELILDIFAARAKTHEARLQVELAQLEYTYPRLRAMWSHLERIAGGAPTGLGTRGPGEQQLEVDRRIIQRKKLELKRDIVRIQGRKSREVEARNRDHFTIGLVGYTNAGKSTLFNTLTPGISGDKAYTDDKLFATLSTRTRQWNLGAGETVMLSDTVGFVRNLPHHLVASFKATLEEAIHSDLLLVVLDVAHPRAEQQLETVYHVLDNIGATTPPRLLVLNQVDRLEHNADLLYFQKKHPACIALSAKTGQYVDQLIEQVRTASRGGDQTLDLTLDQADGKAIHFIEQRADVTDRQYNGQAVTLTVCIGTRQLDQLRSMRTTIRWAIEPESEGGWG